MNAKSLSIKRINTILDMKLEMHTIRMDTKIIAQQIIN